VALQLELCLNVADLFELCLIVADLFSGEARLALVTLAGRTELPIMAVFRAFVSSRLGD
jgi:hypothetical protein